MQKYKVPLVIGIITVIGAGIFYSIANTKSDQPATNNQQNAPAATESDSAKPDTDYKTLETGLQIKNLVVGTGDEATQDTLPTIQYIATLDDGTVVEDTYKAGEPERFLLGYGKNIEGIEKGIVGMKVGGKRSIIMAPEFAYGKSGSKSKNIPGNATITYVIELTKVEPYVEN